MTNTKTDVQVETAPQVSLIINNTDGRLVFTIPHIDERHVLYLSPVKAYEFQDRPNTQAIDRAIQFITKWRQLPIAKTPVYKNLHLAFTRLTSCMYNGRILNEGQTEDLVSFYIHGEIRPRKKKDDCTPAPRRNPKHIDATMVSAKRFKEEETVRMLVQKRNDKKKREANQKAYMKNKKKKNKR